MRNEQGAELVWLPFDLHPEYPREGIPRAELERRYGAAAHERLRELFSANGLTWNPGPTVPNSRAALRMTELARDRGLDEPLHDRLMDAMWAQGEDIGDHDVLRRHTDAVGLERDEVDRVLGGDEYLERVRLSTEQAAALGITGIPAFLIDSRLLVLGAQPVEAFERAFAPLAAH